MEENNLKDKLLICKDCKRKFTFEVRDQKFYGQKDWNDPVRCRVCRRNKKIIGLALEENVPVTEQISFRENCDKCGRVFYAKIKRQRGKSFYCDDCYKEMRNEFKNKGVAKSQA